MKNFIVLPFCILCLLYLACQDQQPVSPPAIAKPVLLLNITSSGQEDPHAVTMALQLAGHALDDGRDVVLFFNVRGVSIPTVQFPAEISFHDKPITELLKNLIDRGSEVQVCPHCMKAMGLSTEDLISGAMMTDKDKLFSRLGSNTVVFTY